MDSDFLVYKMAKCRKVPDVWTVLNGTWNDKQDFSDAVIVFVCFRARA